MSTIIDWERIAKQVIAENEQLKIQLQNVSEWEFIDHPKKEGEYEVLYEDGTVGRAFYGDAFGNGQMITSCISSNRIIAFR